MLARYLDSSSVGDPMALIIGLSGTFSLWILGRPLKDGGVESVLRNLSIDFFYRLKINQPRMTAARNSWNQLYYKLRSTRSRKRLPEESYTRSNAKIVIVFTLVRHHAR